MSFRTPVHKMSLWHGHLSRVSANFIFSKYSQQCGTFSQKCGKEGNMRGMVDTNGQHSTLACDVLDGPEVERQQEDDDDEVDDEVIGEPTTQQVGDESQASETQVEEQGDGMPADSSS